MNIENELSGLVETLPDGISEGVALGTGLADGFDLYPSPVGEVVVTFNIEGVSSVDLATEGYEDRFAQRHGRRLLRAEPPSAWGRHIPEAMEAGSPGELPVDLRSRTPFQARVLRIAASIPRGEVRPYGWLAREADRPGAARAVGSTMARNPIPLIIPCHRVVRSDGHLGEYSLGGPHNKWDLLSHEGGDPARLVELAEHHVRVQGDPSTGVYCHPTCHVIRRSGQWTVVDFTSTTAALASGFTPCEVCRPG
ncbi:MAG: methylated-DNA--[protein]-cysteine S-methyltransferase [Acidimicrobiia bacterium]